MSFPEPAAARPLRVLCAEDNPVNQRLVRAVLGNAGADVRMVDNGLQALDALYGEAFDLVLMDIRMPVMDGLEATRRIRRMERSDGRAPTPILALSANALPEHIAASTEAGMDGHVGKPFRLQELFSAMAEALRRRAAPTPGF